MAEGNGTAPIGEPIEAATVAADELDALLHGLFEPTTLEFSPGRIIEVRPLLLAQADRLYLGGLTGAPFQRFLLARCAFVGGKALGEAGADRLPVVLASQVLKLVMKANGMDWQPPGDDEATATDPKA